MAITHPFFAYLSKKCIFCIGRPAPKEEAINDLIMRGALKESFHKRRAQRSQCERIRYRYYWHIFSKAKVAQDKMSLILEETKKYIKSSESSKWYFASNILQEDTFKQQHKLCFCWFCQSHLCMWQLVLSLMNAPFHGNHRVLGILVRGCILGLVFSVLILSICHQMPLIK